MINAQGEFEFTTPPAPPAGEIDRLCHYLEGQRDWKTAKQIKADLGFNERKVRQLAEQSDNRIVSGPGCPGYRHFRHCTCEEITRAADKLLSQGRRMMRRAIRLKNLAHQAIH